MKFAQILADHWPRYVQNAAGRKIPAAHWRAVESVLSCRTPRRGGRVHHCTDCNAWFYFYHSCNHRSCPQCGANDQALWSTKQEAKLLPVEYYLLTITVPEALRPVFYSHQELCYGLFISQSAKAVTDLCENEKHLGGTPGFIAVFQSWTRRMHYHPHLHILIPAVALAPGGCKLAFPPQYEYFLPVDALARRIRTRFSAELLLKDPEVHQQINPSVWTQDWVVHCQAAGTGRSALRYLAGYIKKSAFNEGRLGGYDSDGKLRLRWKDSTDGKWKIELLEPQEFIDRWLKHVFPKGFVAVRYYGWLSAAAHKAHRRVRFLLGRGPLRQVSPVESPPQCCPKCRVSLQFVGTIPPSRGPPLSRPTYTNTS